MTITHEDITLPNTPPPELYHFVNERATTNAIVYKVTYVDRFDYNYSPLDPDYHREKAIECHCTACGTEFIADYHKSQCCSYYSQIGFINPENGTPVNDRETMLCPYCGAECKALHTSSFGSRAEYTLDEGNVMTVQKIGNHVALMSWYARKLTDKGGTVRTLIQPWEAYVTAGKKLLMFVGYSRYFTSVTLLGRWKPRKRCDDLCGLCESKYIFPFGDYQIIGTEVENSALNLYLLGGDSYPVTYLSAYLKHPNIENLITSGAAELLNSVIKSTQSSYGGYGQQSLFSATALAREINLKKAKPHEMFGLPKQEYKTAIAQGMEYRDIRYFKKLRNFDCTIKIEDIPSLNQQCRALEHEYELILKKISITRAVNYALKGNSLSALVDYWRTAEQLNIELNNDELLLPKHLDARHNELVEELNAQKDREKAEKYKAGFDKQREKYAALAYSDGELCVFVCPSYEDLRREGRVLHHCVGSFSNSHITDRDVIFFVRHARRPERCYYTLDIRMTDKMPYEVQLHGYGNERHGCNKQYSHSIPAKVREFCDRWEREILMPWANKQKKEKKRNERIDNPERQPAVA